MCGSFRNTVRDAVNRDHRSEIITEEDAVGVVISGS